MATETLERTEKMRYVVYGLIGLAVVIVGVGLFFFLSRPPQMGTSEEAFRTVDALYTAVRSHDEKRLTECQQRLHAYRDAGKLPPAAADSLDAIIRKAQGGSWDSAAERLYDFMLAQRREGVIEHEPKPKAKKK